MIESRLRIDNQYAYFDAWRNITATALRDGSVCDIFLEELEKNSVDVSLIKNYIWIFDNKPEGISPADMEHLHKFLLSHGVPEKNFRVIYSCAEDVGRLPYPARSLPDRLIYNGNWFMHLRYYNIDWINVPMTHRLVCLMRRPSISRGNLAKRLLNKFRPDQMIMTFGTNGSDCDESIKKLIWPQPYPMIVDRPMADYVFQHRIDHDFFYRAPVNVIVESSSQIDPNTWSSIFVTEKTFKAMAWHQFPIWYAVPGLIKVVRSMGFDVFDDLLEGHFYDDIEEPWIRMTQVVSLVKRFCDTNTVDLRKKHWDRLQSNARLIETMHEECFERHSDAVKELIYDT